MNCPTSKKGQELYFDSICTLIILIERILIGVRPCLFIVERLPCDGIIFTQVMNYVYCMISFIIV